MQRNACQDSLLDCSQGVPHVSLAGRGWGGGGAVRESNGALGFIQRTSRVALGIIVNPTDPKGFRAVRGVRSMDRTDHCCGGWLPPVHPANPRDSFATAGHNEALLDT